MSVPQRSSAFLLGDVVTRFEAPVTGGAGTGTVVDILVDSNETVTYVVYWRTAERLGTVEERAADELLRVI